MTPQQLFNLSLYELHLIIDCRNQETYKNGFISSSINICSLIESDVKKEIQEFIMNYGMDYPKKAVIVAYDYNEIISNVLIGINIEPAYLIGGYESFYKEYPFMCTRCEGKESIEDALVKSIVKLEPYPSLISTIGGSKLYIGNIANALNANAIKNLKITHILNVTPYEYDYEYKDVGYIQIPIDDDENVDISNIIVQTNKWILSTINLENKSVANILIHCSKGKSRSVSILSAFMIDFFHMSYDNVIAEIRKHRPIAEPNRGFIKQLRIFANSINVFDQIISPKLCGTKELFPTNKTLFRLY